MRRAKVAPYLYVSLRNSANLETRARVCVCVCAGRNDITRRLIAAGPLPNADASKCTA